MERERVKDACWLLSIEWVKERPPAFWVLSFLNTWHLHFGWLLVGYSYRRGLYNTVKTSREYSSQKTSFLCLFGIWGRHWSTSKLLILSIHNHIKKKKQRYVLGFFGWYLVVWFSFWLDMTLIIRTIWFQWLHTNLCLHRYSRTEMEGHPDPTSAATAMIPEASIRRINLSITSNEEIVSCQTIITFTCQWYLVSYSFTHCCDSCVFGSWRRSRWTSSRSRSPSRIKASCWTIHTWACLCKSAAVSRVAATPSKNARVC